jgi:hypothetical protein
LYAVLQSEVRSEKEINAVEGFSLQGCDAVWFSTYRSDGLISLEEEERRFFGTWESLGH